MEKVLCECSGNRLSRRPLLRLDASTQKGWAECALKNPGYFFHFMNSNRQLGHWFAHAATGFAVTDVNGNVVDANEALARIVDRTPAEIHGANLFELTHPEDQARHRGLLEQLLAAEIPGFVIEKRYLRGDGNPVWVRNSVTLVKDDQHQSHVISICEDISQHKLAEQALEKQEQMAAMGRLISSILHEINNPLEAAFNLLFLAQGAVNLEDARPFLRAAEEQLSRASEITAQGLQFHRQPSYPASANVIFLMQSVLALFKEKLRLARVEVTLEAQDAPELLCFAGELRQVFVNLIGNAVESIKNGGRIVIRVRPGTSWQTGDRGVRITIADTGSGMTLETRKHMYDAFYTTKGSGGSGLGLWVTARIVRKHRGLIYVRSRRGAQGGGSAFILVFPYAGAEGKTAGLREHAA
jgi:PAS domain S-box-containing protein